ncbi:hypothetical protein [Streptomyces sp. NPDC001135]
MPDRADALWPPARDIARAVAADAHGTEPRRLVRRVRDGVLRRSGGRLGDDTTVFAARRIRQAPGEHLELGRLRS